MKGGVCDYVSKYKYDSYDRALAAVPDDPSQLDAIHEELKLAFRTGKTRDLEWRVTQLKRLMQGLDEMKDEFCEAVAKDLGRGAFYTQISEVYFVKIQCQHTIDHLHEWA
jgi:acyl-CoA reductase-like NAD-dependent aldehyde dehydrogenase